VNKTTFLGPEPTTGKAYPANISKAEEFPSNLVYSTPNGHHPCDLSPESHEAAVMDHLWAPWRLAYVAANKEKPTASNACFICHGLAETEDRNNLIVHRTEVSVVLLNKFPYNNGHLLVCPQAHKATLDELTEPELLDQQVTIREMSALLTKLIHPDGFNIGLNLGRVAGAGHPGHLHWHIVPRWNGDTNFMPVTGDTRVIVQSLEALYDLLKEAISR